MATYINLAQITYIRVYLKSQLFPETLKAKTWVENGGLLNRILGKTPITVSGYCKETWNGTQYLAGQKLVEYLAEYHAYVDPIDSVIYYYPHVEIDLADGIRKRHFFKTEAELDAWISDVMEQVPTIKILKK